MAELDEELDRIFKEFDVPNSVRAKFVAEGATKLWHFSEYVDDINDWTAILAAVEPAITDRIVVAKVRRAYKAACQHDSEIL